MTHQSIKEIEKGCGKEISGGLCCGDDIADRYNEDGEQEFVIVYCPTCQAKLQQAKEFYEKVNFNDLIRDVEVICLNVNPEANEEELEDAYDRAKSLKNKLEELKKVMGK